MMIYGSKILSLFVFCSNIWSSHAFVVHQRSNGAGRTNLDAQSDAYDSFIGNLNQGQQAASSASNKFFAAASENAAATPAEPQEASTQMNRRTTDEIWQSSTPVRVQGGSLRTCTFDEAVRRVQVMLRTEGRPLNSNIDLWQGPDNTPEKLTIYLEDGDMRPFRAVIETPGDTNAIAIYNTGQIEYPMDAAVEADIELGPSIYPEEKGRIVQGGAVFTTPFSHEVASVQIMIRTDGRPLNARIELLQGPNNIKQVMEVYTEDGTLRPFYVVIETPGAGNVIRLVNTATMEYPISALVEPYLLASPDAGYASAPGGGMTWSS